MAHADSLISSYGPDSPFLEAYRYLRTNLLLGNGNAAPRVVAVVAARPGTGTSTTVANLGISGVEVWKNTVLVDADLRRPSLARMFGLKQEPGLAEVLAGKVPISKAVHQTPVQGLRLVPAGKVAPGSLGQFEVGIGDVLKHLREHFDFVIVDTPAAAIFPDALIVSAHVDGVVLVAKAREPHTTAFDEVRRRLETAHASILGVVFNNVSPEDDESLRYYREYKVAR